MALRSYSVSDAEPMAIQIDLPFLIHSVLYKKYNEFFYLLSTTTMIAIAIEYLLKRLPDDGVCDSDCLQIVNVKKKTKK